MEGASMKLKNVETFYASGHELNPVHCNDLRHRTWEFLSFGYWKDGTHSYLVAAENLLRLFLRKSGITNPGRILSVACGYGTETFSCYQAFKPSRIDGVDVTKKHVDYSNGKAKEMQLDDRIVFHYGDACSLDFPAKTFSHIIGIEGPAHFQTRNSFFIEARRVLKAKGEMILTDIVLGRKLETIHSFRRIVLRFAAKKWYVTPDNWVVTGEYRRQLFAAGFSSVRIQRIGDNVFPGYAHNAFAPGTIINRIRQRGILYTLGLTIISWLLGYLYKKGIIEYIFVKATV